MINDAADEYIFRNAASSQMPPYSQEAEEALIGSVINNDRVYYDLPLIEPDEFYLLRHAYLWQAITTCVKEFKRIDPLVLCEYLENAGRLDLVGGQHYISSLMDAAYDTYNAPVYAQLVKRCAIRRELLRAADHIKALAVDEELATPEIIHDVHSTILRITADGLNRRDVSLQSIVFTESERMDKVQEAYLRGEPILSGLPTGFSDLDAVLGGLKGPDFLLFAGRPGMGKSAFITSMLLLLCRMRLSYLTESRRPRVGVFTLEMSKEQYARRLLAGLSRISIPKLNLPHLLTEQENYDRINAEGILGAMDILIDDTPRPTPEDVMQTAMRWALEGELDLVAVDHLARMAASPTTKGMNKEAQVGHVGVSMKTLARELNIPVWCAHQLNRAVELRADKRPIMSDLRDSGRMEEEADVIMFLYRDAVYNEASTQPNLADVIIAKHRNGPTGTVSLYFNKSIALFENGETRHINLENL